MVPARIWLSYKQSHCSVQTKELNIVEDLVDAVQKQFSCSLRDFDLLDISLHTTEDAEALDSALTLVEIVAQFTSCAARETPLIVKVNPNVAPGTSLPVNGIPARICLSFKKHHISVQTKELNIVEDLMDAVQKRLLRSLRDFDTADISLHTTEDAEALTTDLKLAAIAAQLSPCGDLKTPLIVKVNPNTAPVTSLTVNGIPTTICLSFRKRLISVQTKELDIVQDLLDAAQKQFSRSLRDFDTADISLHTTEDAEALTTDLQLAAITAQVSPCGDPKTPLIVKARLSSYDMELVSFWKFLPKAKLVTHSGLEHLQLKNSDVLGRQKLGSRFLVRPIYQELHQFFKTKAYNKIVVTGLHNAWTLLITSPEHNHYHQLSKEGGSKTLFMPPWSYKELKIGKAILYPKEATLPTVLMDAAFEWFGGVPRYVLEKASAGHKALGTVKTALAALLKELTLAIHKEKLDDIVRAHQNGTLENHSHRVIHTCSYPSGDLPDYHLAWASHQDFKA
ncbi:hypothetical protein Pst134EA_027863 [Puccinia striiformis f. sp. tritici]|uniref:hypothetical protein n=1 Tax=Puccinia striiformis f. sp. tritici TaxID=168172 RepID=UPI0020088F26|nr:hypothetical protein Pst134EA_027863 [Puccinia striiformis f. sp. tritici]KAH9448553.1 hypothetical protein Pst134EA_027863 [Puccinia striiformis f. sp. tritici]